MLKKSLSALLCILMVTSVLFTFTGCKKKDANYPLTIGHTEIKKKPEKVAVLSDNLADIIYYLGYSTQMCAISDQCTQPEFKDYFTRVGDETNPDVNAIVQSGAEYVLTDKPLSQDIIKKLEEHDITTLNLIVSDDAESIKTVYQTLGKLLGGKSDGLQTATSTYNELMSTLENLEKTITENKIIKVFCYLYMDENGNLCSFNSESCEGFLLSYACATSVSANFKDSKVELDILKYSSPDFIFYDDDRVLEFLQNSNELKNMRALKNSQAFKLSLSSLQRHGFSMPTTLFFMLSKMFPEYINPNDNESYAEQYGITFTEDTLYKHGDESQDIIAIQKRLIDLGYLDLGSDPAFSTHYGEKTKAAVLDFQKSNGITETGEADFETLTTLFLASTLTKEGLPFILEPNETPEPTDEPATEVETGTNPPAPSGNYTIDLSEYKTYDIHSENCDDIRQINARLMELGYLDASEAYDEFDWRTSEALAKFQEENGLTATGGGDYTTLKKLFSVS